MKMKKKRPMVIGVCILCAAVMLAAYGFSRTKETQEDDVIWREYQVGKGDITASFDESGKLIWDGSDYAFEEPECEVELKVKDVFVEEGDWVQVGDALVSFDKNEIEKAIEKAEQELEQAKRDLEDAKEAYENAE